MSEGEPGPSIREQFVAIKGDLEAMIEEFETKHPGLEFRTNDQHAELNALQERLAKVNKELEEISKREK